MGGAAAWAGRRGVAGGVAEIGVHHGRCFIALALSLAAGERAAALDAFEDQHLNVDGSGRGDRAVFEADLAAFGTAAERVTVLKAASLDVGPERIAEAVGPVRFVAVDGGHWVGIVLNAPGPGSRGPRVRRDHRARRHPASRLAGGDAGAGAWLAGPRPVVPFAMSAKLYLARSEAAELCAQALGADPRLSFCRAPTTARWRGAEVGRFIPRRATFEARRPGRRLKHLLAAAAPGLAAPLRRAPGVGRAGGWRSTTISTSASPGPPMRRAARRKRRR